MSVYLFVTFVYCMGTDGPILIFFHYSVAPLFNFFEVFPHEILRRNSDVVSLAVASTPGGLKNRDFRPVYRFISEMIQDRVTVILHMNSNRNSYAIYQIVSCFTDLEA